VLIQIGRLRREGHDGEAAMELIGLSTADDRGGGADLLLEGVAAETAAIITERSMCL